jgi:zinc transport system ATP-binding protein
LQQLNHEQQLTILLVTHDLQMVPEIAQRLLCLNRRLVFDGSTAEFAEREQQILAGLFRGEPAERK